MTGEKRKNESPHKNPGKSLRSQRSRMDLCRICRGNTILVAKDKDELADSVKCTTCGHNFHLSCAGISTNFFCFYIQQQNKPWNCYSCDCETRISSNLDGHAIAKFESLANQMNSQVQALSEELMKVSNQNHSWQQEFECKLSDIIDQRIENKVQALSSVPQPIVSTLNTTSNPYRKNLIITCVPEHVGENVMSIVKKLAKQINFLQDSFIDNCFRVEKRNFRGTNEQSKPPAILLKCTTEIARDNFLRCYFSYIKKHPLTPSDIGMDSADRIYVNEHMNPELQPLLKKALALRRNKIIAQVASHSTYLSIKIIIDDRPTWKRIFNEEDLNNLMPTSLSM